jgi:SAM-dependent methyltransferase
VISSDVYWIVSTRPDLPLPHGAGETSYKRCWNSVAAVRQNAYMMVDESSSEDELVKHGRFAAEALREGLALTSSDVVLDVGCGVARVGREVAGWVRHWIGVDVSENMLAIARERLAAFPNVTLIAGSGSSLEGVADSSIDKGYSHAVFIHMDKEDFYNYLLEIRRVLKPDGLFYFDVWNLCNEAGWLRWELERAMYPDRAHRPIHRNQFHAPDEVRTMLARAGLTPLFMAENYNIQVVASRPPAGTAADGSWMRKISAAYGGCYRHLRWREDNVAEVTRLVRGRFAEFGSRCPDQPGGPA